MAYAPAVAMGGAPAAAAPAADAGVRRARMFLPRGLISVGCMYCMHVLSLPLANVHVV